MGGWECVRVSERMLGKERTDKNSGENSQMVVKASGKSRGPGCKCLRTCPLG